MQPLSIALQRREILRSVIGTGDSHGTSDGDEKANTGANHITVRHSRPKARRWPAPGRARVLRESRGWRDGSRRGLHDARGQAGRPGSTESGPTGPDRFGRRTPPRPQPSDLRNDSLAEDASNLGLILNRLRRTPAVKKRLLKPARNLYDGLMDFDVIVGGGTVQVFLEENGVTVPATRLSDGTLRYLSAGHLVPRRPAAIRVHRGAGTGPASGHHADARRPAPRGVHSVSIAVHDSSDVLVDALTDEPQCVVVYEKHEGRTRAPRPLGPRC